MSGEVVMETYAAYRGVGTVILKRWNIVSGSEEPVLDDNYIFGGTLEEVRLEMKKKGMCILPPYDNDDPTIIETYL